MRCPVRVAIALACLFLLASCIDHDAAGQATARPPAGAVAAVAYAAPADPLPAGGACAVDAVAGVAADGAVVRASSSASFGGWVADARGRVPADARLVLVGEGPSYALAITAGGSRPDVAEALGNPALGSSGFNLDAYLAGVVPGRYRLSVVYPGHMPTVCALDATITVQ
ncbi:hypothetical protein [Pseudoxanthomonas jiangsuensis]|uniref:hypothetical protein n=1 Tax=Pseudoxanthomonas jiangsuensis TaxID=619688 RepID=UPI001392002D|nr:hypothetical protein [Pseudoxanthomonas jiangsuensis]